MKIFYCLRLFCGSLGIISVISLCSNSVISPVYGVDCPLPAIERFQSHKVQSGETLESIATQYKLTRKTLLRMNPDVGGRNLTVGEEILIPPSNGSIIRASQNQTWKDIAAKHKIRADVLFEVNGCQEKPTLVFVPELDKSSLTTVEESSQSNTNSNETFGYPLSENLQVGFPYGWQINPNNQEVFFHSGTDLLASNGASVKAIASGTVVFAGEQGSYGNLIIINHSGGLQSRYAHLGDVQVNVGQTVNLGDSIGTVGSTGEPTLKQPHLHFEIRSSSDLGWVAKDPKDYWDKQ